ncbi:MAG: hypothetical protein MZU91_13270 [Desulfosudis oleivorans]|nr:hypothetical protein [Desulfosudis oleivorans]
MDATYSYDGKTYPAIIKGVRDPSRSDISRLTVKTGSLFSGPGRCVVITGMEDIGAKEGGQLDLRIGNVSFTLGVTGTVQSAEHLFAAAVPDTFLPIPGRVVIVYMDLGQLQDITTAGTNDIILRLKEGYDKGEVVASLDEVPISRVTYQEDHPSVLFMELGAGKMRNMFPMLSVIFMVIGIISIFMTLLPVGDERFQVHWGHYVHGPFKSQDIRGIPHYGLCHSKRRFCSGHNALPSFHMGDNVCHHGDVRRRRALVPRRARTVPIRPFVQLRERIVIRGGPGPARYKANGEGRA